jgi:hypothetical protein
MIAADVVHAVDRQRAQQQQLVACGLYVEVFWGDVMLGLGREGQCSFVCDFHRSLNETTW